MHIWHRSPATDEIILKNKLKKKKNNRSRKGEKNHGEGRPARRDAAVRPWFVSLPSCLRVLCYWTIGHSPVHSSKHTMLPDGELQKTCRLSPSNSKILAADLEREKRGWGRVGGWVVRQTESVLSVNWANEKTQVDSEPCITYQPPRPPPPPTASPAHPINSETSLTRYEVACCDGNISLHQRGVPPVEKNTQFLRRARNWKVKPPPAGDLKVVPRRRLKTQPPALNPERLGRSLVCGFGFVQKRSESKVKFFLSFL